MFPIAQVNLLAVLVAVALNIVLGMTWYSPRVFGAQWMKLVGVRMEDAGKGMAKAMTIGITGTVLGVILLAVLHALIVPVTFGETLTLGALLILAFPVPHELGRVAWEMKPWELFWVNAPFQAVGILLTLTVLQWWPW